MKADTLPGMLAHWSEQCADRIWLKDLNAEGATEWSWGEAHRQVSAIGAMLETRFGHGERMVVLSRNRAHWFMADLAIIASGNITVSMFTTLPAPTAKYLLDFTDARVMFVGETSNWDAVSQVLPANITLIALPGIELDRPHLKWEDALTIWAGKAPAYKPRPADVVSLVFTSGTTGLPKGVIQTHESNLIPIRRCVGPFGVREGSRYFSYLPLSHIAERQIVEFSSLEVCGEVSFNQSLDTLAADLQRTRPNIFFGPPRIWEQFQHAVIAKFGGDQALADAMSEDPEAISKLVVAGLGLDAVDYCLTAAAPTPPALIEWFGQFGLTLMEGFGQTEAMGLIINSKHERRIGSIGKPLGDVEYRITDEGELAIRAQGCTPGYYNSPQKTAELLRDGWLHTGDKARVDADGFLYITGRVKDYFKTIHGKFVAPPPIENEFAKSVHASQQCLLGRGYSKTVMVVVITDTAAELDATELEQSLRDTVEAVNAGIDKHERIGAVMITKEPWTIENEVLTPTLKLRRDRVEDRYGQQALQLARQSAERGELLLHWADG